MTSTLELYKRIGRRETASQKWQEQVNTLISKFRKKCIEERKELK